VVVADAIYIVPTPTPTAASFAWTPDIPATAAYQIYARWTAGPDRAANAKYLVEHSGGTAEIAVNQRRGGGIWNLLGTFTMPSGTGNRIILSDDGANGTLVADAIRITREVDGGNIAYVHTDQLGQPQKLTDASKAVVWDRVARPFGATAAETGTTAVALRFPGQWADARAAITVTISETTTRVQGDTCKATRLDLGAGEIGMGMFERIRKIRSIRTAYER
jgi:RHS protein